MQRVVRHLPQLTLFIFAAILFGAAAMLVLPGAAAATSCQNTVTVANTSDSAAGSLRQAIIDVCAGGTINFNPTLTSSGPATITLASGELGVTKDMTITGPGPDLLAVSGNNASRVFNVSAGVKATIDGLTVRDGSAGANAYGGGILGAGVLTVTNSAFISNSAYYGGGVSNSGSAVTVMGSIFIDNRASGRAGGLHVGGSATATVVNSTFYSNTAGSMGGAIAGSGNTITVTNSTFSRNSGGSGGAVIRNAPGVATFTNVIMEKSTGVHCSVETFIDGGGNVADDSSCSFTAASSRSNMNPMLSELGNYGGGTQTLAPLPGSPAIDSGVPTGCPATDQRNMPRPMGGGCDSGAVESMGFALTIDGGSPQAATVYSPFAEPLTLTVSSRAEEPVGPGGVITFTPPVEGPGLSTTTPFTATTDASGVAASGVITANSIAGSYGVTVTTGSANVNIQGGGGGVQQVVFDLTNQCLANATVTDAGDDGPGTLRQAIRTLCPGGVIDFNFNPTITSVGLRTITLTSGELDIKNSMTISGPGADQLAVSGNAQSSVFVVWSSADDVTIRGLTIRDGQSEYGAGITNAGTLTVTDSILAANHASKSGGGIINYDTLAVDASAFTGNSAGDNGGAIYSYETDLAVSASTFTNNTAEEGGAVAIDEGNLAVVNCTFTGNSAVYGGGGGIAAFYSTASVINSTFVGNSGYWGSGVSTEGGALTLANTILARSAAGGNCSSSAANLLIDGGGNLEDATMCGFSPANGSRAGTDPLLGDLQVLDEVELFPLLPGSPAIDFGGAAACPADDQRGVFRPYGAGCDSGAFESRGFELALAGGSPQTTTVFTAFAAPLAATVSSRFDEPVGPGGVITFTPPADGPGLNVTAPFTAATDATGLAVSGVLTANALSGSYDVVAKVADEYNVTGRRPGPTSVTFNLTNTPIDPTVTLAGLPNPSYFGQSVTLIATVATQVQGASTPTGDVTFTEGAAVLGSAMLDGNGTASLVVYGLAVGDHTVTATYTGDASFAAGSANGTQTVTPAPTMTELQIRPNPALYGDNILFGANVQGAQQDAGALASAPRPEGQLHITDTTGTIDLRGWVVAGKAVVSGGIIPAGEYTVYATYLGNESFAGSTAAPVTLTVAKHATATALASSSNPVFVNDPLALHVAVGGLLPDAIRTYGLAVPTGAVVVADTTGALNLGGSLLNGELQLPAPALPAGIYTVTATYLGDERYAGSVSTALIQVIERQPTWTGLALAPDLAQIGDAIRMVATVGIVNPQALGGGAPAGTVQFLAGDTPLGTALLSNGQALLDMPAAQAGVFAITARYLGNDRYARSTSDAVQLAVDKYETATTLAAFPNPSRVGETVTFTATVAGASERYAPTGVITFTAAGAVLGAAPLGTNGYATFATNSLAAGAHTITAQYGGDAVFTGSTSDEYQQVVQIMPLAVNDAAGAQQDPVSINVTANDLDPAGGGLTIVSVTAPAHGSATVEPNSQNVIYTPPASFSGIDTFTYVIRDSHGNEDDALVAVVVTIPPDGQGKPQVQATDPLTDTDAAFTGTGFGLTVLAPAGFFTGTLAPKDVLFISFTPVLTPTEETNQPPANLKFGNVEYRLEVYLNDQLLTGQTFAVPLVVTITYDPAVLGSLKPETLGLWHWDGAAWSTGGVTLIDNDVANHTITVSLAHFSLYALFAAAPTALDIGEEPERAFNLYLPAMNK